MHSHDSMRRDNPTLFTVTCSEVIDAFSRLNHLIAIERDWLLLLEPINKQQQ